MQTVTINTYKFSELSEEAKQVAINWYRDGNQWDLLPFFADECNETLEESGFVGAKVSYSLSWCQGDGLSFNADYYNKLEELFLAELGAGKERTAKLLADSCNQVFKGNNGRYSYASASDVDLYIDGNHNELNNINATVGIVLSALEDLYMDTCKKLEKQGYAEIEWQNSDEAIIESIEANDYDFLENGKIW
jgi:hypothetical protein